MVIASLFVSFTNILTAPPGAQNNITMTLQEFKSESARRSPIFDNSENASSVWSRSWGFGQYWRDLWFFNEYRLGNLVYRTGKVHRRHDSYTMTECSIDGNSATEKEFIKHLSTFEAPELTDEEQNYIEQQRLLLHARLMRSAARRNSRARKQNADRLQLTFNFESA